MNLDELLAAEGIEKTEGLQGVRNLAKLARLLGYRDGSKWGQFEGGCYGDLLKFLEDNPFIIEAIHDCIQSSPTFKVDALSLTGKKRSGDDAWAELNRVYEIRDKLRAVQEKACTECKSDEEILAALNAARKEIGLPVP